jgi:hypothetical protein
MNYIFNPAYKLINDKDRILLINNVEFGGRDILCFIHPAHAMLLCFFDGLNDIAVEEAPFCCSL